MPKSPSKSASSVSEATMDDAGLYMAVSGAIAGFFALLGPLLGKRMQRRTEQSQEERSNFDTMFQATMKMLDQKDAEMKRMRAECDADLARVDAQCQSMTEQLERARKRAHELNSMLHYYTMRFGNLTDLKAEDRAEENGGQS